MILHVILILLTSTLMLAGLIGSVLPLLPGAPLILFGAFLYAWHTDFAVISWSTLLLFLILTILCQALDYFVPVLLAKRVGASKWGMAGAFLGGIIGIFGGVIGILLGPFLGAFLLEWIHVRRVGVSFKIGWGTVLGLLGGTLGKLLIAAMMIGIFLTKVIG